MNKNEQMRNAVSLDTILSQLSEEKVQLVTAVVAGSLLTAIATYFDSIVEDAAYLLKEAIKEVDEVTCTAGTSGVNCTATWK